MSGIDEIVEMILKEARRRPGEDITQKVGDVLYDTRAHALDVVNEYERQERREKENENKG